MKRSFLIVLFLSLAVLTACVFWYEWKLRQAQLEAVRDVALTVWRDQVVLISVAVNKSLPVTKVELSPKSKVYFGHEVPIGSIGSRRDRPTDNKPAGFADARTHDANLYSNRPPTASTDSGFASLVF